MFLATLSAGSLGLAACATTVPVAGAPTTDAAVTTSGGARWSARIASVTQNRGDVAQSTRDNSYGSAEWTRADVPTLSKFDVVFTYAGTERDLAWAVLAGSCGTAALPVIPLANFPELNVGGGSRAQVSASLPIDMPATGAYHIDIYKDNSGDPQSLVGCGDFRYRR